MPVTAQSLSDELIAHHVDISRYSASVQQQVLVLLQKMQRELIELLAKEDLTAYGKTRTEWLLRQATSIIDRYYVQADSVMRLSADAIVPLTAQHAAGVLDAVVEVGIGLPTATTLERLVSNVLIQGSPLADWWSRQAADTVWRFSNAVRMGMVAGETNAQIITRIAGNRTVTGVMDITRSNAAALVQTATATVANAARDAAFRANADVVPRIAFLATLDNLTCAECAVRDGKEWTNDSEHDPIGHSIPYSMPGIHPQCRCVLVGRVSSEFFKAPIGQRASMTGPVKGNVTFAEWLSRRTPEQQDEQFGPGRMDLFRRKVITFEQLMSPRGNVLTVKQLKAKYA